MKSRNSIQTKSRRARRVERRDKVGVTLVYVYKDTANRLWKYKEHGKTIDDIINELLDAYEKN